MKVILALDSFKGCLSSPEAEKAAAEGLPAGVDAVLVPISDGGEGFTAHLTEALGGALHPVRVHDPLGRPVTASFGLTEDGVGIVDTASASGLQLLSQKERNPLTASSYGTGELLRAAAEAGARKIYFGLGGSATADGGEGMLQALEDAGTLPEIHCFCDVDTPFTGAEGAVAVFAPQKGATPAMLPVLEARMKRLEREYRSKSGIDLSILPGSGAAGGMGGAAAALLHADLHIGIEAYLRIIGLEVRLEGADAVITGEGKSDSQTLRGKAPFGILKFVQARRPEVPVFLVSGTLEDKEALLAAGFADVQAATPEGTPLSRALDPQFASKAIESAIRSLVIRKLDK